MGKRCSKCHKNKALTEFYKHKTNRDGLNGSCKECSDKYRCEYGKTDTGKGVKKKSNTKYHSTKSGLHRRRIAYSKYQKTAKGKEATLRATSKKRSIFSDEKQVFTLSLDQWLQTLKYFKNRCAYCGKKSKKLVHEHVIPLERGGWHTRENVVPACTSCNLLKGRKIPFFEWNPQNN